MNWFSLRRAGAGAGLNICSWVVGKLRETVRLTLFIGGAVQTPKKRIASTICGKESSDAGSRTVG